MPYAGQTLMGRQFVALIAPHWPNEKVKATATAMGESALSIGAWHDNQAVMTKLDPDQVVLNVETYEPTIILDPSKGKIRLSDGSVVTVPTTTMWIVGRDCGAFQNNIPAKLIGSDVEASLRTESKDEAVFMPVVRFNIDVAYHKWTQPWIRDGKQDYRRWQPWYAYTNGWAMFPHAYVWKQVDGEPVGPWQATGRYLYRAIRAVANWHHVIAKDMTALEATEEAKRLADHFGIKDAEFYWHDTTFVTVRYSPVPSSPPSDGVGPRPVQNDGR